jgi:hypothetical protein
MVVIRTCWIDIKDHQKVRMVHDMPDTNGGWSDNPTDTVIGHRERNRIETRRVKILAVVEINKTARDRLSFCSILDGRSCAETMLGWMKVDGKVSLRT